MTTNPPAPAAQSCLLNQFLKLTYNNTPSHAKQVASHKEHHCFLCGSPILATSTYTRISFNTKRPNEFPVHFKAHLHCWDTFYDKLTAPANQYYKQETTKPPTKRNTTMNKATHQINVSRAHGRITSNIEILDTLRLNVDLFNTTAILENHNCLTDRIIFGCTNNNPNRIITYKLLPPAEVKSLRKRLTDAASYLELVDTDSILWSQDLEDLTTPVNPKDHVITKTTLLSDIPQVIQLPSEGFTPPPA
jgi:hypothetical protein